MTLADMIAWCNLKSPMHGVSSLFRNPHCSENTSSTLLLNVAPERKKERMSGRVKAAREANRLWRRRRLR